MPSELFQRYQGNPILSAADWPYTVNAVFNPGVTRLGSETLLLVRVEDRSGPLPSLRRPQPRRARGLDDRRRPAPATRPRLGARAFRDRGRAHHLCGDEYMIVYTGYSNAGPLVCLASTRDFESFERRGTLMPPEDKDAALFPCTFGGRWALIHRPVAIEAETRSAHLAVVEPRPTPLGRPHDPPPRPRGRLVGRTQGRPLPAAAAYRTGLAAALPRRSRHRRRLPLPARTRLARHRSSRAHTRTVERVDLRPRRPYERSGDVSDVVFPCGWVLDDDGDTLRVYYGAADSSVCVATASLAALLAWLERHQS